MKVISKIFYCLVVAMGLVFGWALLGIQLPERCGPWIAGLIAASVALLTINLWERLK